MPWSAQVSAQSSHCCAAGSYFDRRNSHLKTRLLLSPALCALTRVRSCILVVICRLLSLHVLRRLFKRPRVHLLQLLELISLWVSLVSTLVGLCPRGLHLSLHAQDPRHGAPKQMSRQSLHGRNSIRSYRSDLVWRGAACLAAYLLLCRGSRVKTEPSSFLLEWSRSSLRSLIYSLFSRLSSCEVLSSSFCPSLLGRCGLRRPCALESRSIYTLEASLSQLVP